MYQVTLITSLFAYFFPDIQTQINSLNSAIENVNEKFYQLKPRTFSFSSSAEIENHYDNYSNNVQNGFYYAFYINHGAGYSTLGGGSWYVEGLKTSNAYEWQRAISYNGFFYRIKNASNWGNWKKNSDDLNIIYFTNCILFSIRSKLRPRKLCNTYRLS